MRIAVFGAGAIGGYFAARLARAGRDVAVVARGAQLNAIRSQGLTLETPDEEFTVYPRAHDDPAELGVRDLVMVTTKTTALPVVARAIGPMLDEGTAVLFAQNGVWWWYADGFAPGGRRLDTTRLDREEVLHRLIGPERALGGVLYSPNETVRPGTIRNGSRNNRIVVGDPMAPGGAREARIVEALSGAGFVIEAVPDIREEMWRKLLLNLSNAPLAALTRARIDQLGADPAIVEVSRAIVREAGAVAAAHGFGIVAQAAEQIERSRTLAHKPSLLQDLERGGAMEIDSMVAIVRDFAAADGIAMPTLDAVAALLELAARVAGCYPPPA